MEAYAVHLLGLTLLLTGANWFVNGGLCLAWRFGMSTLGVGLTITAVGTSLPELVVSGIAAFRGQTDIAVGNAIGSNILNLLWVLGVSAQTGDLVFFYRSNLDLLVVALSSAALVVILVPGRHKFIHRWHGVAMLFGYSNYLVFLT